MDSPSALPAMPAATPASMVAAGASDSKPQRPPWREPLVWLVFGIPALTVVAGLSTLVIAARGSDLLVVDDYRKYGLSVSRLAERDDTARRLAIGATLGVSATGAVSLQVTGDAAAFAPTLTLRLLDPARPDSDLAIRLVKAPAVAGLYNGQVDAALVSSKAWLASVEAESWRLDRRAPTMIGANEIINFAAKPEVLRDAASKTRTERTR